MSRKYIFAVIGGDYRQIKIIKRILEHGHFVKIFGINAPMNDISGAEISSSAEKAIQESDIVLLPLPVSRDNINLNLTSSNKKDGVLLNDIIKSCAKNIKCLIIGGLIPYEMSKLCDNMEIDVCDYYESEDLQQKNAIPSAEGAIMIAMENTDRIIEGMNVLISGYGRIGKILAHKLKALGAIVTVAARRDETLCEISISGFNAIRITDNNELSKAMGESEVIFNTVPKQIFSKQIIEASANKPLYIEIASSPGGIDIPTARTKGIQVIFAPSLPGKYAPASSGDYIFETIKDILEQRGIIV